MIAFVVAGVLVVVSIGGLIGVDRRHDRFDRVRDRIEGQRQGDERDPFGGGQRDGTQRGNGGSSDSGRQGSGGQGGFGQRGDGMNDDVPDQGQSRSGQRSGQSQGQSGQGQSGQGQSGQGSQRPQNGGRNGSMPSGTDGSTTTTAPAAAGGI